MDWHCPGWDFGQGKQMPGFDFEVHQSVSFLAPYIFFENFIHANNIFQPYPPQPPAPWRSCPQPPLQILSFLINSPESLSATHTLTGVGHTWGMVSLSETTPPRTLTTPPLLGVGMGQHVLLPRRSCYHVSLWGFLGLFAWILGCGVPGVCKNVLPTLIIESVVILSLVSPSLWLCHFNSSRKYSLCLISHEHLPSTVTSHEAYSRRSSITHSATRG